MISIQPKEKFPIVRVLGDHTDATTYYVRATIRDPITDTTLAVLALADLGSRRFYYEWEAPSDVSGLGRYVDITTEVFTDSGYSSKASTYADENNSYLVWDRISGIKGGGSSADIDYKKITKIVKDATPKPPKEVDFYPLQESLKSLEGLIRAIKVPEAEKINLSPLMAEIENLSQQLKRSEVAIIDEVQAKEIPEQEKIDFAPLLEAFQNSPSVQVVEAAIKLIENFDDTLNIEKLSKVKDELKTIVDFMSLFITKNTEVKSTLPEPVAPKKPSKLRPT